MVQLTIKCTGCANGIFIDKKTYAKCTNCTKVIRLSTSYEHLQRKIEKFQVKHLKWCRLIMYRMKQHSREIELYCPCIFNIIN